tara:strand:+ start:3175 stop:3774 length:600 start_codon:yes stop_codon:yes gene_type:complete
MTNNSLKNIKLNTFQEKAIQNAQKSKLFAGKRFLGFTKHGSQVWISMEVNKDHKDLVIKTTHNLDALLEDGAELVKKRIVVKKGGSNLNSVHDLIRRNQKNMGGEVNENTITYMKKLISASEMKDGQGFVKGEVTRSLFMYASNAIFEGDLDVDKNGFGWSHVIQTWQLPDGEYFTIDSIPLSEEIGARKEVKHIAVNE